MPVVYINIGSNLGDRASLIDKAIEEIGNIFGYYCNSRLVESKPWGFDSANPFLNIGVAFKSDLHPEAILDILQAIEKKISKGNHRDAEGHYVDREIDIDIMAIEDMRYDSQRLHIPHRHLNDREFFLVPLHDLGLDLNHAGSLHHIDDSVIRSH